MVKFKPFIQLKIIRISIKSTLGAKHLKRLGSMFLRPNTIRLKWQAIRPTRPVDTNFCSLVLKMSPRAVNSACIQSRSGHPKKSEEQRMSDKTECRESNG